MKFTLYYNMYLIYPTLYTKEEYVRYLYIVIRSVGGGDGTFCSKLNCVFG